MPAFLTITTQTELAQLIQLSQEKPIFLLKHSTRCPISARAFGEFQNFVNELSPDALLTCALVRVIEERDVSDQVAQRFGVNHESPQLLLISNGKVVWHDSHWGLTKNKMQAAATDFLKCS